VNEDRPILIEAAKNMSVSLSDVKIVHKFGEIIAH